MKEVRARKPATDLVARSLFALTFSFYALTGSGHSQISDGYVSLMTARGIYREGRLAIDPVPGGGVWRGTDGRLYAIFAPAAALVMIPALVMSDSLPEWLQPRIDGRVLDTLGRDEFWMTFVNAALMAVVVALVFLCAAACGATRRGAIAIAGSIAIASPLWLYARIDGSEALQAVGLIGSLAIFLRRGDDLGARSLVAAGSSLGLAIAAKPTNFVALPWLVLLAFWRRTGLASRMRAVVWFSAPLIIVCCLIGIYNAVRFGSPLATGYPLVWSFFRNPILEGGARLLLFPSHGLLWFWPGFALALLGAPAFARERPAETMAILGIFATTLCLYASWIVWWGASWGPRFLVPTVPLLALFLTPITKRRLGRAALLVCTLAGLAVQSIAVVSSYRYQVMPIWYEVAERPNVRAMAEDSSIAPLRVGYWFLRQTIEERRGEGNRASERLQNPPWSEKFPWRRENPGHPDVLAARRGLDLWLAPERWKLRLYDYKPTSVGWSPIPSNPALTFILAFVGVAAASDLIFLIFSSRVRDL